LIYTLYRYSPKMTMIGKHPAMEQKAQTTNNNLNISHPRIHGDNCLSQ
jgi:hypothetical protein